MKNLLAKSVLPAAVLAGSLGLGVVVATPSGASTHHTNNSGSHHAAPKTQTWSGKVKKANTSKHTFSLVVSSKTYAVVYTSKTKFTKGSSSDIKPGASVSVTGALAKSVIAATSISA